MSNNIYVTKTAIAEVEVSEIDFLFNTKFGFDYDTHDDIVTIENGQFASDSYPIEIDKMIEILQSIKEKGANYVELNYHCDHIGYEVFGFDIRTSTPEEIAIYTDKKLSKKAKEDRINELLKEINAIKQS
jgi:predicted metallo-beta-lactamase superfamily hydrolase